MIRHRTPAVFAAFSFLLVAGLGSAHLALADGRRGAAAAERVAASALPADTTLIIVRHGEKPSETADALSEAGKARAQRLAKLLAHSGIDTVYTSPTARARQTAEPLAAALNIAQDRRREYKVQGVKPAISVMEMLGAEGLGHVVLIVGHSDTVPDLLKTIGGWTVTVNDHEDIFVVTQPATGGVRLVRAGYPPARDDGSR